MLNVVKFVYVSVYKKDDRLSKVSKWLIEHVFQYNKCALPSA